MQIEQDKTRKLQVHVSEHPLQSFWQVNHNPGQSPYKPASYPMTYIFPAIPSLIPSAPLQRALLLRAIDDEAVLTPLAAPCQLWCFLPHLACQNPCYTAHKSLIRMHAMGKLIFLPWNMKCISFSWNFMSFWVFFLFCSVRPPCLSVRQLHWLMGWFMCFQ